MKGACTHFHIVWLQYHATLICPIIFQGEHQSLKGGQTRVVIVRLCIQGQDLVPGNKSIANYIIAKASLANPLSLPFS